MKEILAGYKKVDKATQKNRHRDHGNTLALKKNAAAHKSAKNAD